MKQLFVIGITSIALMSFISGKKPSAKTAMKQLDEFCAYVPSGNTLIEKDTVSVQGFYISQGEVTNFQYAEFLSFHQLYLQAFSVTLPHVDIFYRFAAEYNTLTNHFYK